MMTQEQKSLDYSSHANVFQDNSAIPLIYKAPFPRRKAFPRQRGTFPADSTLARVYMTKKLTPLPEPRALAHALIVLTRLSEPKSFYMEKKLIWLGG